jgi:hypothetical protein
MLQVPANNGITDVDSPTMEWLASEEFPHRALGMEEAGLLCAPDIPGEQPTKPTEDWLLSQEFPTKPLLCPRKPDAEHAIRRDVTPPRRSPSSEGQQLSRGFRPCSSWQPQVRNLPGGASGDYKKALMQKVF